MTTTALPDGIYRIQVVGGAQPLYLTREKNSDAVTVLPPNAQSDPDQEWSITNVGDENIVIERPSRIIPGTFLTYKGAPKKPAEGDQIIYRVFEFPPNEWHAVSGNIRVAGSDLGIKIAPLPIYPPILALGLEDQLKWEIVRVRDA